MKYILTIFWVVILFAVEVSMASAVNVIYQNNSQFPIESQINVDKAIVERCPDIESAIELETIKEVVRIDQGAGDAYYTVRFLVSRDLDFANYRSATLLVRSVVWGESILGQEKFEILDLIDSERICR